MIKRIIFDIDNTLIPWKTEYYEEIKVVLDELNIEYTENDCNEIKKALSEYENVHYSFNRKLMIEYINEYTKKLIQKNSFIELLKNGQNVYQIKLIEV